MLTLQNCDLLVTYTPHKYIFTVNALSEVYEKCKDL